MQPARQHISTLSDFLRSVRDRLQQAFPETYWVSGETAGVKTYPNRIYFDLLELHKGEKVAQVKVSVFGADGLNAIKDFEQKTGQQLVAGLKIGARFRVSFHEVYGLQLSLCEIDAEMTLGGIELQRKLTLLRLVTRYPDYVRLVGGEYSTSNKELRLPAVIQRVAVISSPNAEGFHDFMHTLETNPQGIRFQTQLFPATVHGTQAASDIISAFRAVYDSGIAFDAIALIRGGGAAGDFMPYDDENLGIVIARARYPVITGIGHHNNQGICDLMAAVHEKTPTAAAKFLVDRAAGFILRVEQLSVQISTAATKFTAHQQQGFKQTKQQLQAAITNRLELEKVWLIQQDTLIRLQATNTIKRQQQLLNTITGDMAKAPLRYLAAARTDLGRLKAHLLSLSPQRTLERGFAIITKKERIVTDGHTLSAGDDIEVRFAHTTVATQVKNISNNHGTTFEL